MFNELVEKTLVENSIPDVINHAGEKGLAFILFFDVENDLSDVKRITDSDDYYKTAIEYANTSSELNYDNARSNFDFYAYSRLIHAGQGAGWSKKHIERTADELLEPYKDIKGTWFVAKYGKFQDGVVMGVVVDMDYYSRLGSKQLHSNNPLNDLIDF